MNIREFADAIGAIAVEHSTGNEEITHATAIEDGNEGAVSFIGNPHYERFLLTTGATAVIVSEYFTLSGQDGNGRAKLPVLLRAKSPYEAFAKTLELFKPERVLLARGVHPTAAISPSAQVHPTANIGAHVYIGERVLIGHGSNVLPGACIGADTKIGSNSVIHPNAVVYDNVEIGNNVVIGAGSVIGFDGFGYVPIGDGSYKKIPQVGNVVIEDNVEIGANCTIDRATVAETRIKRGVKMDNLIQIAHNVEIGENSVIAAQTGVSGSSKIGKQNIFGGQVGITGHIHTADHVIVGAQSGVSKTLTKSGTYFGYPAREYREALKVEGAMRSIPGLIDRVKKLEAELEELRVKD
jgi:UDP-3-O-[3-hydroxymyristoyl] glucosamine N-acyltransferase